MNPYDEQQGVEFQRDVMNAYAAAGQPLDLTNVVWSNRMTWDSKEMGYAAARAKHLSTLRAQLGLNRPVGLTENLVTSGQYFALESGEPWTAIECSDFALLAKWCSGEDISPVLQQRADCGFNLLRVWTLFDIPGIGTVTALDYGRVHQFVAACAAAGLYVEFTAYTGINDALHWSRLVAAALRCRIRPLLELVNELDQNTNEPDARGRVFDLTLHEQAPAPILSSHGSNGSQALAVRPAWSYETFHTNDAAEWWRKVGHNAMEMAVGTEDWPGSGLPVLSNENTRFPDRDSSAEHAYDAAAGAALLCAGSCYHSTGGKQSVLWSADEERCARAWAAGARSVDLRAQGGSYRHAGELEGAGDLRVYQRVLPDGRAWTVKIRK